MKYIHNLSGVTKTYQSIPIDNGVFFEIPSVREKEYAEDDALLVDIASGAVFISKDGATDISGISAQIDYLKGTAIAVSNFPSTLVDSDGAQITKPKTTNTGWHYEPRSIDYETGKYNSQYNRKHNGDGMYDGTDYGDAWLTFLDAAGDVIVKGEGELDAAFQARLDTNCVTTFLDWHANYSFDIIGGMLQTIAPEVTAYMWAIIAPDIPEAYGGSVPFLAGGFNLKFFDGKIVEKFDGRGVKRITPDFVYNSSKFRIIIKHPAGLRIPVQVYFEHFKA